MITRIKEASGDQFKIKIEVASQRGSQIEFTANVNYLVVEAGVYNESEHGIKMEAMLINSTTTAQKGAWTAQRQLYNNY